MRIIIDGDSCPVIKETIRLAKKHKIDVILIKNHHHQLHYKYPTIVSVDARSESADMKIVNLIKDGDIVVTQDFGLAGMIVSNTNCAITPMGKIIDTQNIDRLLYKRDLSAMIRSKHKKYTKFKKRTSEDDQKFYKNLEKIILNKL